MQLRFALAARKLSEVRREFEQMLAIERAVVPRMSAIEDPSAPAAVATLRASLVEGVYTGVEGVLKLLLTEVDGDVAADAENWHAALLAQAASPSEARAPLISEEVYLALDQLRAFRHVERNHYRHVLVAAAVDDNVVRLHAAFPALERELLSFMERD